MASELELYLKQIGLSTDMLLSPNRAAVDIECTISTSQTAELLQEPCSAISDADSVSNFAEVENESHDTAECFTVTHQTAEPSERCQDMHTEQAVAESDGNISGRLSEDIRPPDSEVKADWRRDVTVSEESKATSISGEIPAADSDETTISNNLLPTSSDCCQTTHPTDAAAASAAELPDSYSSPDIVTDSEKTNDVLETNSLLLNSAVPDNSQLSDIVTDDITVTSSTLPDKFTQTIPTTSSSDVDELHHAARPPYSSTVIRCSASSASSVISTNNKPRDGSRSLPQDDAHANSSADQVNLHEKVSSKVDNSEAIVSQKAEVTTAANYVSVVRIGSASSTVKSTSSDITAMSNWSTHNNTRPIACVVPMSRTPQDSPLGPIKSSLKKFTPTHTKQKSVSFSTGSIEEDCPSTCDGETFMSGSCSSNGLCCDDETEDGRLISDDTHDEQERYLQLQSAKNGLIVALSRTTVVVTSDTFQTGEVQTKRNHQRKSMPVTPELSSKKRNTKVEMPLKGERSTERQSGDSFTVKPRETVTTEASGELTADNCTTVSVSSQKATSRKETKNHRTKTCTVSKKKQCKVQ